MRLLKRIRKNPTTRKSSYNVVLDLGFGDSGKGRVVDWLSSKLNNTLVVRFNGGHQAGHHVVHKNISHVFSNFGSGTLNGVPTYWSEHCTVDPVGLKNEYLVLKDKGITPEIFISPHAPITTHMDKEYNHNQELINKHGSVGVGFGATIEREENHNHFKFLDIFYDDIFYYKKEMVFKYYRGKTRNLDWGPFNEACEDIREIYNEDIHLSMTSSVSSGFDSYVYESAQGLLLDKDYGFFPHVTRSSTGFGNIPHLKDKENTTTWLVTRAYQTRHGNGPMTNLKNENNQFIHKNKYEQNKMHNWQGNFRYSVLDLSLLEYSFNIHDLRSTNDRRLVITCVDNLERYVLTYRDVDYEFIKLHQFIDMISDVLETSDIYVSDSPGPKSIYKYV